MQTTNGRQSIHIMTSADEKLMPLVAVQLMSLLDHLPGDININFFLLYDTMDHKDEKLRQIDLLQKFSCRYKNLAFCGVHVEDVEPYVQLARFGGDWPRPAYYSLAAAANLPKEVDRVLYLDAGDVFVLDDFREFYFMDFADNLILATSIGYKVVNDEMAAYDNEDLFNLSLCDGITRGIFNAGVYVMNLEQIRKINFNETDYVAFAMALADRKKEAKTRMHDFAYWGDQGLLSALFVGKIKYYGYPEVRNVWYMPFNFCLWYYDRMDKKPWYKPKIIHFAGAPKPWTMKYPYEIDLLAQYKASHRISDLKHGQAEYYFLWHEYAIKTEMALRDANAAVTLFI